MTNNAEVGRLAVLSLAGSQKLAEKVNQALVTRRGVNASADGYLTPNCCPRFGTGEAKGQIGHSVRGTDLYILVDVVNYSITYTVCGQKNHMSPDDHFQDLKRIIAACGRKPHKITVIMPFLYEGRQHHRSGRESLDCALMLQELVNMGVDDIITFDAHDPRVQNAIPQNSFENVMPTFQFVRSLCETVDELHLDKDSTMVISPDEGATKRAIYLANVAGLNMGTFYKRRDYTRVINGRNPIIAHEFLGPSLDGMDCIVIDDMISSGESMLDVCRQLKERNAKRIFIFATFGLFTNGCEKFDQAYEAGQFDKLFVTNLNYVPDEVRSRPYFVSVQMQDYIASLIDTLNHDGSISSLIDPVLRIQNYLAAYREENQQNG